MALPIGKMLGTPKVPLREPGDSTDYPASTAFVQDAIHNVVGLVAGGVVDNTATLQAAIDTAFAAGGGVIAIAPGVFAISGTLIMKRSVYLRGSARFGTTLLFTSDTADCIRIAGPDLAGALYDVQISDMLIDCTSRTGGRAFDIAFASTISLIDVGISNPWTGIECYVTNDVLIDGVRIYGSIVGAATTPPFRGIYDPGACYGIFFHALSEADRCDVLNITNTVINCGGNGSAGIFWDGPAYTLDITDSAVLAPGYGLRSTNGSTFDATRPNFGAFNNFAIDGSTGQAMSLESGAGIKIDNCEITANGTGGTWALIIGASNVAVTNSRMFAQAGNAIFTNSASTTLIGNLLLSANAVAVPSLAALFIGSATTHLTAIGNITTGALAYNNWDYGVIVSNGSTYINVSHNDFSGAGILEVAWLNTDGNSGGTFNLSAKATF